MMLVLSIVLGILPWFGIAWTIVTGTVATQDGLFMSLILLVLSAVFLLNAYWELRDRGALAFLHKKKEAVPAAKASPASAPSPGMSSPGASSPAAKAAPKAASEAKEAALKESEG